MKPIWSALRRWDNSAAILFFFVVTTFSSKIIHFRKTIDSHHQQELHHTLRSNDSLLNVIGYHNFSNSFSSDLRPIINGSLIIETADDDNHFSGNQLMPTIVSETDFAVHCMINSPSKVSKRIYAHEGKVSKSQLTPIKTGLFQVQITSMDIYFV